MDVDEEEGFAAVNRMRVPSVDIVTCVRCDLCSIMSHCSRVSQWDAGVEREHRKDV